MTSPEELQERVVDQQTLLHALVRSEAGSLLRFETVDDLVQGVHVRVMERGQTFQDRGEAPFKAWLRQVARSYLADRRIHWSALKRRSGDVLRYTSGVRDTHDPRVVSEPAGQSAGPSTFASRREQITLAIRALGLLLPRDRELVEWSSEGLGLTEIAERMNVSYEAAGKARQRAVERFRQTFELVSTTKR